MSEKSFVMTNGASHTITEQLKKPSKVIFQCDDGHVLEFNSYEEMYDRLNKLAMMEQKFEAGVKPIKRDMGKISIFSKIFGYTQYYTCPHCRNCLLTKNANERQLNNNCWDCGGAIDWSDEE